jgi:hypothetical protein
LIRGDCPEDETAIRAVRAVRVLRGFHISTTFLGFSELLTAFFRGALGAVHDRGESGKL